jgi:hypothetical protein
MLPKTERPRCVHTPDGSVILDIDHGRMFTLNCTASVIFQLLERGLREDQIVEKLVQTFHISEDVARSDLTDLCQSLENYALLPAHEN